MGRNVFFLVCVAVFFLLITTSCTQKEETLFGRLPSSVTGIHFENTLTPNDSLNILEYVYYFNGGGVAIGDINNDGLQDIFFSGNQVSSRLYLNLGNLKFKDITETAGVGTDRWMTGIAMADVNGDGWLDIYVCSAGSPKSSQRTNRLFVNNGNATFTELAHHWGLDYNGYSTQAAFFDYDKDGDLDMYLLNHDHQVRSLNDPKVKSVDGKAMSADRLFRNNGYAKFTDVSQEAGITVEGYGLGISVSDINNDGWPDLYVSNDFAFNDMLYINQRDGTFKNEIRQYLRYQSFNAMGNDIADINNDGFVDIMVADMLPEDNKRLKSMMMPYTYDKFKIALQMGYEPQYMRNTLQVNNGDGSFSEIGQLAGVHNTDWSWGPLLADYDNDGYKDLFITNGYLKDMTDLDFIVYRRRNMMFKKGDEADKALFDAIDKLWGAKTVNYIFRNNGDLTFDNLSEKWGFTEPSFSNGAAYGDLDNDGDLDLVVNNINGEAAVHQNKSEREKNHYLQIVLKGSPGNRKGYGAKVWLRTADGKEQFLEQSPYRGFMSTAGDVLHFGLGSDAVTTSLKIVWPDGRYQQLNPVQADQRIALDYNDALAPPAGDSKEVSVEKIFENITQSAGIHYVHRDDEYEDFRDEPLIPHKFSQCGPKLATGDMNGDGLEDIFIGGSANHPGGFFRQLPDGKFTPFKLQGDSTYEDQEVLFFDADQDKDLDLYVVSGGFEFAVGSKFYQHRLYRNDGKGNFQPDTAALPGLRTSGSSVSAADIDKDGDLDLFVGGRVIPAQYPLPPASFILRNDHGKFTDVTSSTNESLSSIGMVTASVWSDIDGDTWPDLILVGEWMPVTVFKNQRGKLINITKASGLADHTGWWNSLKAVDADRDGDMDLIAGNLGLNTPYKASSQEPLSVYAKDFDKNGSIDPIMFYYNHGKRYPTATRDDLVDQASFLRGRFKTYKQYGETTFENFFVKGELEGAYSLQATYMESSYIENVGNGTFKIKALPKEAQFSPVFGIETGDFNKDGHLDILLAGNSYTTHIHTGRYDASYGLLLTGDGHGNFKARPANQSGFFVRGQVTDLKRFSGRGDAKMVVVGVNSDSLRVFRLK
jgi:hypothetical protein